jgi:hypothetical protein
MGTVPSAPAVRQLSVPDAAERIGRRVDEFRKLLRRRPDLDAMFSRVGPLRIIPEARLEELRAALSGETPAAAPAACSAGASAA